MNHAVPHATLAAAIGQRVYDVSRIVSDQLAIDCRGRLRWPIGHIEGNPPPTI